MKISIAMATYNGAGYLQEQLDSFLAQTVQPDELVISDDRSNDTTVEIIERFAEVAPFKVIWWQNQRNLGYGGNFNAALNGTTGDLVFLSDQDDVWFPEKIAKMVEQANSHPDTLVLMNDAELTDAGLKSVNLTKLGQIHSAGFGNDTFVMGCCAAFRREYLHWCLPVPEGYRAHDAWLVGISIKLGIRRIYPVVLQYYRRHEFNESQWIVNRTKKISRWDVLWADFAKLNPSTGKSSGLNLEDQNAIYLRGLEHLTNRAPHHCRASLKRHYREMKEAQALNRERAALREQPFLERLFGAMRLWHQYHHKKLYGLKRILRDIIG